MISYPTIQFWNKGHFGQKVWAFDKLDGSQIRIEWSRKRGFYKFGSKHVLIDETHVLGEAPNLFREKYTDSLEKIFRTHKDFRNADKMTVFAEFVGKGAGVGVNQPDTNDITIFDVAHPKYGIIIPKLFLEYFSHIDIPKVLYIGNYTKQFADEVFNGYYDVVEGVICKGTHRQYGSEQVWMVKAKTQKWLLDLKQLKGEAEMKAELNHDIELIGQLEET